METQLLLTFANRKYLNDAINEIIDCYEFLDNRLFILSDKDYQDDMFISYNVVDKSYRITPQRTLAIHRKRQTNTLYTINAVNIIVEEELGYRNSNWEINWKAYRNSLLLTEDWELVHIRTKLEEIFTF